MGTPIFASVSMLVSLLLLLLWLCGIYHILHWFNAAKLVFSLSGKLKCHHSNAHNTSRKIPTHRPRNQWTVPQFAFDSHTNSVKGRRGLLPTLDPNSTTPPLSVHLHIPQERTHLNRSYQHRIPLCSTVGACICSIYLYGCMWTEDGDGGVAVAGWMRLLHHN